MTLINIQQVYLNINIDIIACVGLLYFEVYYVRLNTYFSSSYEFPQILYEKCLIVYEKGHYIILDFFFMFLAFKFTGSTHKNI